MSQKNTRLNRTTKRAALGAMLTALGFVLVYIGAVTDILDLSMCAAACIICLFAFAEFGIRFSLSVYAATLLLSVILLPTKLAALEYALMALYAILKPIFERLDRIWAWGVKLLYFNSALAIGILSAKFIFMLPDDGAAADIIFAIFGNIAFILFDVAMTRLVILYVYKLRKRLNIEKYLR